MKKIEVIMLSILVISVLGYSVMWIENSAGPPEVVDIYGQTWYELGYDYGVKCRGKISGVMGVLEGLKGMIERVTNITVGGYINEFEGYVPVDIKDEMRGIADGAGVRYDDVFLLNLFFDIYPDVFEGLGLSCSAFIITSKAVASVGPFFGRTVDNAAISPMEFWQVILRVHPPDGNLMIMHTGVGFVGPLTGMNSKGIGLLVNYVSGDKNGVGVPMLIAGYITLLYSNTTEDAVKYLNGTLSPSCVPFASSWNYGLIDRNGAGAVVEVTNELVNVRWASEEGDGWIGATNHFVSMEMYQHNNGISESSVWRLAVIREVLNNSVKFGLVDAVDLLRSHYDLYLGSEYPGDRSVCNHDPMWSSMSAFIVVPKLNYTLVCIGHPCQNDFYLVSFNKFLGPVI
ncbi:MAG: C45 family autoproteolytic acyltransferase/hydrolase [Candidatus Helarchaeota archaeon]